MSIILGCWQYSEDLQRLGTLLQKMCTSASSRPNDPYSIKTQLLLGFASSEASDTPQSKQESQPVYLPERELLFVGQARIDNRIALSAQLNIKFSSECKDNYILLQSYLYWGKDCVNHLRGSWSFAAFDYKQQELYLARDPLGYTSLYYYQDETGFYFSSSIKSLTTLDNYNKLLNEVKFVRTLTLWDFTKEQNDTFFKGIYSITNAHVLSIKNKKVTAHKYWSPELVPPRHYRNKQTYFDEMSVLFGAAVGARVKSQKPVAAMLSGGLDSSAVSYVAADLLRLNGEQLTTFSHVPYFTAELLNDNEKYRMILDETPFIKEVVKASNNMSPIFLNSANSSILASLQNTLDIFSEPVHGCGNLYWLMDIYRTASEKGFGILLTGEGGNGSISFKGISYLLPFLHLHRFFRHPRTFVKTQVMQPLRHRFFPTSGRKKGRETEELEAYVSNIFIKPSLINKYGIIDDISINQKGFDRPKKNINEDKLAFIDHYNTRGNFGAAVGHYFGIELRDPTTDVELMEYFFSIPNEAFFDTHYNNRMLVKRMMQGKLPMSVLYEKRKGLQSSDIVYRVKSQAEEISEAIKAVNGSPAANYYIDTQRLNDTWQYSLKQPYTEPYQIQRILKALQFALFLQMNFD